MKLRDRSVPLRFAKRVGRALFAAIIILFVISCATTDTTAFGERSSDLVVATYNVHFNAPRQRKRSWDNRKDAVVILIESLRADLILFQEMETFVEMNYRDDNLQLDWIMSHLPAYSVAAIDPATLTDPDQSVDDPARPDRSETFPSSQPILYRHDRFSLLDEGFITFSETPDVAYAPPWYGNGYPSFLTWAKFLDRSTNKSLVVANLHFDAFNRRNRLRAAELASDRLPSIMAGVDGKIVGGDFNAHDPSPTLDRIRSIGLSESGTRGSTYHFYRGIHLTPGIDHILVDRGFETIATRKYQDRPGGVLPSDHYPIVVELSYSE